MDRPKEFIIFTIILIVCNFAIGWYAHTNWTIASFAIAEAINLFLCWED